MLHNTCEYILHAQENGIKESNLTFIPAKVFSPYIECAPDAINQIRLAEGKRIEVNPFYRYEEIFARLLDAEKEEVLCELKNFVFDFWIHESFAVERLSGMTRRSFEKSYLVQELREGFLGEKNRKEFMLFSEEEQDILMEKVLYLYSGGNGSILFGTVLKAIFCHIYVYLLEQEKLLVYIGEKETATARKKVAFIRDIFLPIGTEIDVFWNRHFGVFELEETMVLDEVVLI